MDKAIPQNVVRQRRRKVIFISIISLILLALAVWSFRATIHPSLETSEFTTAVVEIGNIENTINASGEVSPEFEQVITSPITATISEVTLDAGTAVKAGQSILSLDRQAAQNAYDKMKFQLESKRNSIEKMRLELNKSFYDISSNNDIKQLRINSLQSSVEDAKRLYKAGGGTREQIEQAELNLKVALLEKKQLENEIRSKQQTMKVDLRESQIAAQIQESDLRELGRKLQQANITAARDGVITYINRNIGSTVTEGESLARIADLESFKITGSISESYLDKVKINMPVIVRINDSSVAGVVSNINPSIQNGIVTFDITLNEKNNRLLRPKMKVDVYLVTASRQNVLKVANGPAFKGIATQQVYVVKNKRAERVAISVGMTNFDYVEVSGNVRLGDVIVTSDMSRFEDAKTITIK